MGALERKEPGVLLFYKCFKGPDCAEGFVWLVLLHGCCGKVEVRSHSSG